MVSVNRGRNWIEEARLQEELAERYAAARQAMERGVPGRALSMFREIQDLEDGYRDVSVLVDQAKSAQIKRILPRVGLGGLAVIAVAVVAGGFFGPGMWYALKYLLRNMLLTQCNW